MAYYFIIHPANDNPAKWREKNAVLHETTHEKKIVTLEFIYRKEKNLSPNRCARPEVPRDSRCVCRYSLRLWPWCLRIRMHCVLSRPFRKYVPCTGLSWRRRRSGTHNTATEEDAGGRVYHRNKGTADSGTYYAAKSNYEAAISRMEFSLRSPSLPFSLFPTYLPLCPLAPFSVPLYVRPVWSSLAD